MKRLCALLVALICGALDAGCTMKTSHAPVDDLENQTSSGANEIFVLAPSTYMRYMNKDEPPLLASEGCIPDLPVYPSPVAARQKMKQLEADQRLPQGFWKVYRLEGHWDADVIEPEPGEKRMRHPAKLLPCSG